MNERGERLWQIMREAVISTRNRPPSLRGPYVLGDEELDEAIAMLAAALTPPADLKADDHARGCQGREYTCTCGYDAQVQKEIADLKAENERTPAETILHGLDEALTFSQVHARMIAAEAENERLQTLVMRRDVKWGEERVAREAAEAENERLRKQVAELDGEAKDESLWRFWNGKARNLADALVTARSEITAAEAREKTLWEKIAEACEWYWPAEDMSSDLCAESLWGVADNVDLQPGEILHYANGGVFNYGYYAFLEAAEDADSADEFEVDAPTEEEVRAAIDAELARRTALKGGE